MIGSWPYTPAMLISVFWFYLCFTWLILVFTVLPLMYNHSFDAVSPSWPCAITIQPSIPKGGLLRSKKYVVFQGDAIVVTFLLKQRRDRKDRLIFPGIGLWRRNLPHVWSVLMLDFSAKLCKAIFCGFLRSDNKSPFTRGKLEIECRRAGKVVYLCFFLGEALHTLRCQFFWSATILLRKTFVGMRLGFCFSFFCAAFLRRVTTASLQKKGPIQSLLQMMVGNFPALRVWIHRLPEYILPHSPKTTNIMSPLSGILLIWMAATTV